MTKNITRKLRVAIFGLGFMVCAQVVMAGLDDVYWTPAQISTVGWYDASDGDTLVTNGCSLNDAAADDGYVTWVSDFKVDPPHPGVGKPIRMEIVGSGVQSLFDNVELEMIPGLPPVTVIHVR